MKNYKRKNNIVKNIFTLLVLGLLVFNFGNAAEKIEKPSSSEPAKVITYDNDVLNRLISKMNEGYVFSAHISSTTVKKDKNVEMAFASFGTGPLKLIKNGDIRIENVQTAFNDRNNFQGKKTVESLTLSSNGNNIKITMQFHTWAQQRVELSNAKITKERYGYFLTGVQTNGSKTVYYTIAISHRGKLI
jgi:hypothetical protein